MYTSDFFSKLERQIDERIHDLEAKGRFVTRPTFVQHAKANKETPAVNERRTVPIYKPMSPTSEMEKWIDGVRSS